MFIRSAFWTGQPKLGQENRLRDIIDKELIPAIRGLPGVADAKALWPTHFEDRSPDIFCQILIECASQDELQRLLVCPERAALRVRVTEILGMFDGSLSHINYEAG